MSGVVYETWRRGHARWVYSFLSLSTIQALGAPQDRQPLDKTMWRPAYMQEFTDISLKCVGKLQMKPALYLTLEAADPQDACRSAGKRRQEAQPAKNSVNCECAGGVVAPGT